MVAAGKLLRRHPQPLGRLRQDVRPLPPRADVVQRLPLAKPLYVAVPPLLPLLLRLRVYAAGFPKNRLKRQPLGRGQQLLRRHRDNVRRNKP